MSPSSCHPHCLIMLRRFSHRRNGYNNYNLHVTLLLNLLVCAKCFLGVELPRSFVSTSSSVFLASPASRSCSTSSLRLVKKKSIDESVIDDNNEMKKNQLLPKGKKKPRSWDDSFLLLQAYTRTNGDCNVPQGYKPDPSLGRWVGTQRESRDSLSDPQRNALNGIGFDWDPLETSWNQQYQKLVEYKQRFGNCNVPRGHKPDPSLGLWVGRQRRIQTLLSDAKREALDSLGFDWDPNETKWNKHYQKLVAYKQLHGDCNVPSSWEEDPFLASWVHKQ
jgi:hypothetical protein